MDIMRIIKHEISKGEYERLQQMSYQKQQTHLFPDGVPVMWECGYGYYGHKLVKSGDEYWVEFTLGSSCD